jgi:hypothetical protein
MKRRVQVIILCEDTQHEVFIRRFLVAKGLEIRDIKVYKTSTGSGEQFVRENFVDRLRYYRSRSASAKLIVMIDGDMIGVSGRINQLQHECDNRGVEFRRNNEAVMIAIPTWNIETWIHFLKGNDIDENKKDYPKLIKNERECQFAVDRLVEICNNKEPIVGCPSLIAACEEYRSGFSSN